MKKQLSLLVLLAACTPKVQTAPSPSPTAPAASRPTAPGRTAVATIRDGSGRQVGSVTFTDTPSGLLMTGSLNDLGLGAHGMHLHAVGKCEAPFTSAGPHFNPLNRKHGYKSADGPHLGDLGNAHLPAAGSYGLDQIIPGVTLTGENGLIDADGAAIVIHAAADDYVTDPSGNSGGRVACGVITLR